MSDFTTKRCDAPGCGRLKREANHWFIAVVGGPTFAVYPYNERGVRIRQRTGDVNDVCGEDCAHKLLSEWFQQQQVSATGADENKAGNQTQKGDSPSKD